MQFKSDGRPPDLRGFLSKWVNYRSGWRTRWFVLEKGVLSYCECCMRLCNCIAHALSQIEIARTSR